MGSATNPDKNIEETAPERSTTNLRTMARTDKALERTSKPTQSPSEKDTTETKSNHKKQAVTLEDKKDKPTHVPNITEEIRKRYERKLAELQAARTVKNPERAEKLRRKRANRKAQRQAAKTQQAQAQKVAKANPNSIPTNTQATKDAGYGDKLILSKMDGPKRKERAPLPKNPSQALQKLHNHEQKLKQLDSKERNSKKKDEAWARAIQKSKGLTIRDDEKRLQASLKNKEKEKKRMTKDWGNRQYLLKKRVGDKQQKRQENIKQRIDAKKAKKMKRRR
jgi:hypothetical protein